MLCFVFKEEWHLLMNPWAASEGHVCPQPLPESACQEHLPFLAFT